MPQEIMASDSLIATFVFYQRKGVMNTCFTFFPLICRLKHYHLLYHIAVVACSLMLLSDSRDQYDKILNNWK